MTTLIRSKFADLIADRIGLTIRPQDWDNLQRTITAQLKSLGLITVEDYYRLLDHSTAHSTVWRNLVQQLTTTESYFFRDQGQFALLRQLVLPRLIDRQRQSAQLTGQRPQLRLWSAGCSTGEEAYSLAILVQQLIPDYNQWDLTIWGTDINNAALERARRGVYSNWSFRSNTHRLHAQHFRPHGDHWEIDPQIRAMVTFRWSNLVQDAIPNADLQALDLIVCRNVFIYFQPATITPILQKFFHALRPQGYLMVGHTELQGCHTEQFERHSLPDSLLYQRPCEPAVSIPMPAMGAPAIAFSTPRAETLHTPHSSGAGSEVPLPRLGEEFRVRAEMATCITNDSPVSQPVAEIDRTMASIQTLLMQKQSEQVIQLAMQVLATQPHHYAAQCAIAEAYANLGNYAAAIEAGQQASQIAPFEPEAYYVLAAIAEETGEFEMAKSLLRRIIYLAPNSIAAYMHLAMLYERDSNCGKAKKMWHSALGVLPSLPDPLKLSTSRTVTHAELKQFLNHKCAD